LLRTIDHAFTFISPFAFAALVQQKIDEIFPDRLSDNLAHAALHLAVDYQCRHGAAIRLGSGLARFDPIKILLS
jgi:hypothetical protein